MLKGASISAVSASEKRIADTAMPNLTETTMTPMTLQRLLWQLPVWLLLLAVSAPGLQWFSASIGLWPLWLTAMPVAAWVLVRSGGAQNPHRTCYHGR